jgi:hypothetical protein
MIEIIINSTPMKMHQTTKNAPVIQLGCICIKIRDLFQSSASTRKSCSGHSSYFKLIFRVRNDIFFNLLTNKNRNFDTMRILIAVHFLCLGNGL